MNSEILIYQNSDGNIKIDVRLDRRNRLAYPSHKWDNCSARTNVLLVSISEIFLVRENWRKYQLSGNSGQPLKHGAIREVERERDHYNYNLDVIISVGYRVKSVQGTQFRIWATQRLKEYIIKGFTLNDDRFKSGSSMNYFNELQDRIREIRLSEKFFYQKIKTSTPPV
jgi:hypothetical protein